MHSRDGGPEDREAVTGTTEADTLAERLQAFLAKLPDVQREMVEKKIRAGNSVASIRTEDGMTIIQWEKNPG